MPKWSYLTTWRRTPCGRWRWAARTGCTCSVKSGPKVAAILSVVESCRRLGLPVKDYLLAVLPGMSQRKHSEAAPLTPARWKASQPSPGQRTAADPPGHRQHKFADTGSRAECDPEHR